MDLSDFIPVDIFNLDTKEGLDTAVTLIESLKIGDQMVIRLVSHSHATFYVMRRH
jgi:hypothetical protein